ncbi:MAG: NUDIX hydrolase [Planctomycetes bacterium]|nr:NUDIX hydrolase [Planctomycetota bacterium]
MTRRDSAFAVIHRRQQVLLVKPTGGRRWQLPGGGIKPNETPWTAAVREVLEETGLDAQILALTGIYRRSDGSLAYVFAARVGWQDIPRGRLNEIAKRRWIPVVEAGDRLPRASRARLKDALRKPGLFRTAPTARVEERALLFSAG